MIFGQFQFSISSSLGFPSFRILVVSRTKFQSELLNATYELELLREEDAVSLFCHTAFGKNTIPPGSDENLIKQVYFVPHLLNI